LTAVATSLLATACHARQPQALGKPPALDKPAPIGQASVPEQDPLAGLRAFENAARARTEFARAETSETALGADPYVIREAGSSRLVGLLRGRSALVELDASLTEIRRLPAPESPTGLAIAPDGEVFVVGELSNRVARYRRTRSGELEEAGSIELPGVRAMRDVAIGPEGVVYVVEEHDGRLLARSRDTQAPSAPAEAMSCHGPMRVMRAGRAVLVDCLLDHAIVVRSVDRRGFPTAEKETRIVHDGPMWGLDALDERGDLLLATGGVEDHPLDRTQGSFAFVDSFVTLYRVHDGTAEKLNEVNTSEFGVVTPKALKLFRAEHGALGLAVAGCGSDRLAVLRWDQAIAGANKRKPGEPAVRLWNIPPGSAAIDASPDGSFLLANPLLDAWVRASESQSAVVVAKDTTTHARGDESRLGEALFFTSLMAPWQRSDGRLSRFTCETCHFEGYVDGRVHHTGRGDVHATTKPLLGLQSNRPYFSRAFDPDLTTMVDNEFGVANSKTGHDPWFSLSVEDFPWLKYLSVQPEMLGPEGLRAAFMTFLMDFKHRPNPSVLGRGQWTDKERAGAEIFRDKCEGCHEARIVADDPSTRQPFAMWEPLVLAPQGTVVWAKAEYATTGVLPYVTDSGARVVSLRRLYKKYPYFTNGSAKSLRDVLDRVGIDGGRFFHDHAPEDATALGDEAKTDLLAFLDLL
jgi:hypothetical protein